MTVLRLLAPLLFVAAAAAWFFYPESGALIWHLRHGSAADFSGISFPVPLLYSVSPSRKVNVLNMVSVPGRARNYFKGGRKVGMINIYQPSDGHMPPLPDKNVDSWASHTYTKTLERASSLAGHAGTCIGFTGGALWSGEKDIEIHCVFQGAYEAQFSGTETEVDDFFRVMNNAQAEGKN